MTTLLRRSALVLLVVTTLLGASFLLWALTPHRADEAALSALESDELVTVTSDRRMISFTPRKNPSGAGLAFYPGGRVEAEAYAPLARSIAEQGHLVVIVRVPFNLAVLGIERADRALRAHPRTEAWAVGGHSLGGAMAAEYAARRPGPMQGVFLLAAYPGSSTDLSASDLTVMTVHASNDGLVSTDDLAAARPLLPRGSRTVPIPGGNHAGFGSYGPQRGDGESTLGPGAQIEFAARYAGALLDGLIEDAASE